MCEWCGHDHDEQALCAARPKWSRRGFVALFWAGIASAVAFRSDVLNAAVTIGAEPETAIALQEHMLGTRAVDEQGCVYRYVRFRAPAAACHIVTAEGATYSDLRGNDGKLLQPLTSSFMGITKASAKRGEYGWIQTFGPCAVIASKQKQSSDFGDYLRHNGQIVGYAITPSVNYLTIAP